MRNSTFIRMAIVCFASVLCLSAQEPPPELPPVRVAFRTLLLQGSLDGPHLRVVDATGAPMSVMLFTTNISRSTYRYTGPNPLVFYQDNEPVARFTVPEGMNEMILLFVEQKNREPGEMKFRIFAMNADSVNYPLGSYFFMNFSGLEVAVEIDEKLIRLKPGDQTLVSLPYEKNTNITARFAELRGGEWVRSYQLAWYFKPTVRSMVFLTRDDDVDRSLRLRTITDRHYTPLPPPEEEEQRRSP